MGGIQFHAATNVGGFQPGQASQVALVHQQPMFPGGGNGGIALSQFSGAPVAHHRPIVAAAPKPTSKFGSIAKGLKTAGKETADLILFTFYGSSCFLLTFYKDLLRNWSTKE